MIIIRIFGNFMKSNWIVYYIEEMCGNKRKRSTPPVLPAQYHRPCHFNYFIIELTTSASAQDWERASTGGSTVATAWTTAVTSTGTSAGASAVVAAAAWTARTAVTSTAVASGTNDIGLSGLCGSVSLVSGLLGSSKVGKRSLLFGSQMLGVGLSLNRFPFNIIKVFHQVLPIIFPIFWRKVLIIQFEIYLRCHLGLGTHNSLDGLKSWSGSGSVSAGSSCGLLMKSNQYVNNCPY